MRASPLARSICMRRPRRRSSRIFASCMTGARTLRPIPWRPWPAKRDPFWLRWHPTGPQQSRSAARSDCAHHSRHCGSDCDRRLRHRAAATLA
jgi:hypothetical protein